jgi:hypothetical protein
MSDPLVQDGDRKINPNFAHIQKENEAYNNTLMQAVEEMKQRYPQKYLKAQSMGNSFMNLGYELNRGVDEEGDRVRADNLIRTIRDYGLDDLNEEETELLVRVYGKDWKRETIVEE